MDARHGPISASKLQTSSTLISKIKRNYNHTTYLVLYSKMLYTLLWWFFKLAYFFALVFCFKIIFISITSSIFKLFAKSGFFIVIPPLHRTTTSSSFRILFTKFCLKIINVTNIVYIQNYIKTFSKILPGASEIALGILSSGIGIFWHLARQFSKLKKLFAFPLQPPYRNILHELVSTS